MYVGALWYGSDEGVVSLWVVRATYGDDSSRSTAAQRCDAFVAGEHNYILNSFCGRWRPMFWPSLSSGSLRPSVISGNAPCDRQEYLGRKSVWLVRLGDREVGKHRVLVLSEIFKEFQSPPHLPECQKGRNEFEPILNP